MSDEPAYTDPEVFPNGRYWAEVRAAGLTDTNAVIGYDDAMGTYFFVSGLEWPDGSPVVWLGTEFEQFTSFYAMRDVIEGNGLELVDWQLRVWHRYGAGPNAR
ncbi:hypothetical protein [Marinivivus vitaminiproducens]|uniref:hypothetical protein n=1 Tax=Marinivivus vitaminiproducens TaxID=3035935 RepID=UPI0027A62F3C|nr:hypothetical protein P4R82_24665 [Geminicoccaceae bacterium SCSIO 64248]